MLQVTMYVTYDSAEPQAKLQKEERLASLGSSIRDTSVASGLNDVAGQRQTRRVQVKIGIHSGNVIR